MCEFAYANKYIEMSSVFVSRSVQYSSVQQKREMNLEKYTSSS